MHHIAVVGAGQLGSRHLQGLSSLAIPATLYVVDPSQDSRARALARFQEMPANLNIANVIAAPDVDALPVAMDLAIVASMADVRIDLISRLLEAGGTKRLLLEKVLFARLEEYDRAEQLLQDTGTPAWVNLPRRMYDIYASVREFLADRGNLRMTVSGGGWGLGCNGIHFVDLFRYLGGGTIEQFQTSLLDRTVYPARRPGFVEFGGTMVGRGTTGELWLNDVPNTTSRHLLTLGVNGRSVIVDEVGGTAWMLDESTGWQQTSFALPYQSQLTAAAATAIIETGKLQLPDYGTAASAHKPFIAALLRHYNETLGTTTDICPIT